MNHYATVLAMALLACTSRVTLAAGSPGVERQTEGFRPEWGLRNNLREIK